MSSLPKGWVECELKQLISITSGKSLTQKKMIEGNTPVFGGNGITGWHNEGNVFKPTIVIGRVGFYCGSVYITPENAWITDNAFITSFSEDHIDREFLYWLLKFTDLRQNDSSSAQPVISGQKVYPIEVKFLPLAEQKRIVEKLDEVLAQVDIIKARLDGIPSLLKRFRQSVLASAVSGKLTEEWRIGRDLKQRVTLNLNEVTSHVVDCPHSTPKWSDEGRYCVRTTAFNPFYLDLSEQGYVNDEVFALRTSRLTPEAGDILYSREGTVGIACQIPEGVELCLGQRMVVIRANERVDAKYLTIVLNSDHILRIVRELTIGSTAPRVNMKVIRDYPIPVPDCIEQKEIVRLVDQYFAFADTIEAQVKKAQARVNNLTQSILAKAFRGELVPQDPNDEPADKLLERIAQARKETEALAKAAKKAEMARKKAEKAAAKG
ncbi:restriction endonuclease subunit S [Aliivibrio sp. SR45-2]|uniref:restriction endonuclease subunit S n=1 Tax=Aliivibrio sp. SR45-2 TaxID=2760931 RepID=UPI0015F881DB|nr:restriction endonuclease subunit S [Aliivibrio sp. SR45-2]MBB1314187.1 restriction endonuclease subunit S [Aliivibrio sp. SR45-2]